MNIADKVPYRTLAHGAKVPIIGLGTFGSDHVSPSKVAEAVYGAVKFGYRHIDCASIYGNEREIGHALRTLQEEQVIERKDMWITSKVWNNRHERVRESCVQSMKGLQVSYLDLFLVHWPFPNHHEKGVSVDSRDPHAVPYIHEHYMNTWKQMEALVDEGLVRFIGTSNMTIPKLKLVLRDCTHRPSFNEFECHPHFQQHDLFTFMQEECIIPIAYSPIGSPARPERDKVPSDTVDIEDPVIVEIAERRQIHPALVCIKWAVKRGQIPIPFSSNPQNYSKNLLSVIDNPLTDEEMKKIKTIDKNCRLIKGQVFLWKEAKGWESLWDVDGNIEGGNIC